MNDYEKEKRERREQDRQEWILFLQFVASGLIVLGFVWILAWLLGWL